MQVEIKKRISGVVSADDAREIYGSIKGYPMLFFESLERAEINKEFEFFNEIFKNKILWGLWGGTVIILIFLAFMFESKLFGGGALFIGIVPVIYLGFLQILLNFLSSREEKKNKNLYPTFFDYMSIEQVNEFKEGDIVKITIKVEKE